MKQIQVSLTVKLETHNPVSALLIPHVQSLASAIVKSCIPLDAIDLQ